MGEIFNSLNNLLRIKPAAIDEWFYHRHADSAPFFYSSVDIRYSGDKIAPVDTNIFPAGFNNLSEIAKEQSCLEISQLLEARFPRAQKILIIAEFHTRNLFYLENLKVIESFFDKLGLAVKCGFFHEEHNEVMYLKTASDQDITLYPLQRKGDSIFVAQDFVPDIIISNNDFTHSTPQILDDINQDIVPPKGMGWYSRKKYNHFLSYNKVVNDFAAAFNINSFLLTTEVDCCYDVNFGASQGLEKIATQVDKILANLQKKYDELNIKTEPYVYLKANRGTYGMGIMSVHDASEVLNLNRKNRNKMNVIKNNVVNAEILIQEGVPTIDNYQGAPAEPFIYMINGVAVGGILRINKSRNNLSNLNASGAEFAPINKDDSFYNNLPVYYLIARLASLAASLEYNFN